MRWSRRFASAALLSLLVACGASDAPKAPQTATDSPQAADPFARIAIVAAGPLSGLHFEHYGVNPTVETREQAESAFGLQPERASFDLARMQLTANRLPAKASVRVEDFINAIPPPPLPAREAPFHLDTEAFPSPNRPGYHVLRLTLATPTAAPARRRAVMVLDLADRSRLPLLRAAIHQVIAQLGPAGELALVDIDGRILLPLSATREPQVTQRVNALDLHPSGRVAGLETAFRIAARDDAPSRQVIYCADGVRHRDAASIDRLIRSARRGAALGVGLTAVGVGQQQYDDAHMARIALAAGGRYVYLAPGDGRDGRVRLLSDPVVIRGAHARLRFDSASVVRYRLLGHERHAERAADAHVNPGSNLTAGRTVTILYEIKLAPGAGPLGALQIDYADPTGRTRRFAARLERSVIRAAPSTYGRLTLIAAALAEKLRGAWWVRGVTYADLAAQLDAVPASARPTDLRAVLAQATRLDQRGDPYAKQAPLARMTFDHVPITRR